VYNRDDRNRGLLGSYQVYLGNSAGDLGVMCGEEQTNTAVAYGLISACGDASGYSYVTIKKTGAASMYVSLHEVFIFKP